MKDLREFYAEELASGWRRIGSYEDLINSFEHEIVLEFHDNAYLGDSRYILRDGSRYGFLNFGWGSCSGCDALAACETIEEVIELRDSLYNDIAWYDSAAGLLQFIKDRDWSLQYSWNNEGMRQFVKDATRMLEKIVSGEKS